MLDLLLRMLKYVCPLLLFVLLCVPAFGFISPWPVAMAAFRPSSTSGALLVSVRYESRFAGSISHKKREQTYALLPTLKTATVIQEDGEVRTEEDPNGLFSILADYLFLSAGTWWFWFRSKARVAP